jgi:hypothetical protein
VARHRRTITIPTLTAWSCGRRIVDARSRRHGIIGRHATAAGDIVRAGLPRQARGAAQALALAPS